MDCYWEIPGEIEETIQEDFRKSNLSHILAVSGTHITFLITGVGIFLNRLFGKKNSYIITIFIVIGYLLLTGFSSSIFRACMMGILMLGAKICYRKNDFYTSLFVSLGILLLYNPYLLFELGLQFSYAGTLGIVIWNTSILQYFQKKILHFSSHRFFSFYTKITEILAVTISAQIAILPIMLYHLQAFYPYFLFTNFLMGFIVEPITMLGFFFLLICQIPVAVPEIVAFLLNLGGDVMLKIAEIGKLPGAEIRIPAPVMILVFLYYIVMFLCQHMYWIKEMKYLNGTQKRFRNVLELFKYYFRQKRKKYLFLIFILFIVVFLFPKLPQSLKIYFVDVGQGDCTFVETPHHKTILIDGGGSVSQSFSVGEKVLLPYLLRRGHRSIDMVLISHFDQDHIAGLFTVLEELNVKQVMISKQGEDSENYQKFLEIVKRKNIKVSVVKAGDRIKVDKDIYFDILFPEENQISENILNNNSIVAKLVYRKFSMFFTGDIEEIAEKRIVSKYADTNILKSTILKVAHHGSKSSSIAQILEEIKPKIAVIGVGEKNTFGHPNAGVLERLETIGSKIYRTDQNGEITIRVNQKGRIWLDKMLI